jgi:hypothetical protein
MLKRYTVVATGKEGVAFHLLSTVWLARAMRAFNEAKDSGRWTAVAMQSGNRTMMVYRANPERRNRGNDAPRASATR